MIYYPPNADNILCHVTFLNFWERNDNISLMVQDRDIVAMEH